jgi:tetratricopeptide (TPR) repeat protein
MRVTEAMDLMLKVDRRERPSASRVLRTFEMLRLECRPYQTETEKTTIAEEEMSRYSVLAQSIARNLLLHEEIHGHDTRIADLFRQLGSQLLRDSQVLEAQDKFIRALEIYKDQPNWRHEKVATTMVKLGRVEAALGDLVGAIEFVEQARDLYDVLGVSDEEENELLDYLNSLYEELAESERRQWVR